jgi:hypothetical protein
MASDIFTYTSRQKRDKKVFGLPLNLVTNKENKLTVKYSILIKQLSLSDFAFKFWNQLQSQSQETGGLYETQPYELDGNIRCTDNENEIVIGVFSASSIKTKRFTGMFNANPDYPYCDNIFPDWESLEYFLWGGHEVWTTPPLNLELPDTPLYLQTFLNDEGNVRQDTFALTEQSCYDCTVNGGTRTKPDFW